MRRRTSSMSLRFGVTPSTARLLQSSMRCAPPRSAAAAEATDSTQTSSKIGVMLLACVRARVPPLLHSAEPALLRMFRVPQQEGGKPQEKQETGVQDPPARGAL